MNRELLLESILDDSNQLIQLSNYESFAMLYVNAQAKNLLPNRISLIREALL